MEEVAPILDKEIFKISLRNDVCGCNDIYGESCVYIVGVLWCVGKQLRQSNAIFTHVHN